MTNTIGYDKDRELFSLTLVDAGPSGFPPFVNIAESRTEDRLAQKMAASPSSSSGGITRSSPSVKIRRTRVSPGSTVDGEGEVRAPMSSWRRATRRELRRQLGVGFPGQSYHDRFIICDIRAELPGGECERRFYFDRRGTLGRR